MSSFSRAVPPAGDMMAYDKRLRSGNRIFEQRIMLGLRLRRLVVLVAALSSATAALFPLAAEQAPAAGCRINGRASNGTTPLPGVSVVVLAGESVVAATSTEVDGTYQLAVPSGAFRLKAELTGFTTADQAITLAGEPCVSTVNLQLPLTPRTPRPPAAAQPAAGRVGRFETLNVQSQQAASAADSVMSEREPVDVATRQLLPPGFSTDAATESLAVTGNMTSIDRGLIADRMEAITRGEFDPSTGTFGQGFGPGGRGGPGFPDAQGRGGPGGRGGLDGPGGPRDFVIGGRGGRQNAYNIQANYAYGGSALDSEPYQLRADSPVTSRPYSRQTFGVTFGGPVKIPGIYDGQRRTMFTAAYNGNRGDQLFDQYGTVPGDAMRRGDFSSLSRQLVDPGTLEPFQGNQIPQSRMNPASVALLRFIPLPNLEGSARNFHHVTTSENLADNLNLRLTHNFTQTPRGRGAPGARGGGGRAAGPGGRGGRGNQQRTNVLLTAQLQYRRNRNEQNSIFPALGGEGRGSSVSIPLSLNVVRRRTLHNLNVNYTRTTNASSGKYAFIEDVAGAAGISGAASDPFDWGVPTLTFSSLTSVRDVAPSERTDSRVSIAYAWTQPWRNHTLRAGGDYRIDRARSRTDPNARGEFVFTGLYSSGGSTSARGGGLDFADFLLGLPQQAILQYGPGTVVLDGRSMSLFLQDDWRRNAALTLNLGLRYELLRPFTEDNGHMVNLDPSPGFTAVAPVVSGGVGPYGGRFPAALVNLDANNVAPRMGFAWRVQPTAIIRGGYGISYNAGSYASIARQMVGQPPFAVTDTRIGTAQVPLSLSTAFDGSLVSTTTNNYGVDRTYALGVVQTWNGDVSRDFRQIWNVGIGFTRTRGSSLDIVRAPNRGPSGLRIPGVQPFLWQTSEGSSELNAVVFRVGRRAARGIGFNATYTLAKSRDNASTIGGGGTVVAQDDQNLAAEWGLSSFDRRHQLSSQVSVELPFGQNRPWLNNGGRWATLLENWRVSASFAWQSGTPYTPRAQGAAADVARGTTGTLRADYSGQPVQVNDPTIDLFFNTAAFSVPATGTFGNASRNMIVGPGSRQLDAQVARDIRLGRTRVLSVQLNMTNLLNMINYSAIDTVVNSPTFGQVLSVRPMRSMQAGFRFRF